MLIKRRIVKYGNWGGEINLKTTLKYIDYNSMLEHLKFKVT